MSEVEQAIEQQMIQKADEYIDDVIPPEGLVTFDEPGRGGFFGLGADEDGDVDLMDSGSAAFAGFFAGMGQLDMDSDAFGGMGAWAPWGFKRFKKRLGAFRKARKKMARKTLNKVAGVHKKLMRNTKNLVRKARNVRNPFQRGQMLNKAKATAQKAGQVKRAGMKLAKEAAAPRISRAEARLAMHPVVKQMSKSVSRPAMGVMKRMTQIRRMPGGAKMLADASRSGALQKKIGAAIKKGTAANIMKQARKKMPRLSSAMSKARRRMPSWARPGSISKKLFGGKKKKWGLFGLGEDMELDAALSVELDDAAMSGFGQMFLNVPGEESMRPENAEASVEGIGSFLSMGDMDTVTQGADALDITKDWATDDIFGEPLGV